MDFGVLTFFALLFVGLFIHTSRRLAQRWDTSWKHMYVFLVVLNLVIATVLTTMEVRHQVLQADLTRIAKATSENKHVSVHCKRTTSELLDLSISLGYVMWDKPHLAVLRESTCADLRSYMKSDKNFPSRDEITAVHILTHESAHLFGIRNEAAAECWAIQRNMNTAARLGADIEQAEKLSSVYYEDHYPHMPASYKSRECHEGGKYDETPDDGVFP